MSTSRKRGGTGGFSLIEVLVAMAIFTVGATSILALLAAAAATHKRSVDRTRAAMVAEEVIAEVQARYYPGQELRELENSVQDALPERIDGYTWTVFLERPGEEGGKKAARSKAPARLLLSGKDRKAPRTTAGTVPQKSKADPTAAKGKKEAKADPARKPSPDKDSSVPAEWTEEEVLLRVEVGWSQSGRAVTETYDTLILPRRAPPPQSATKKR